MLKFWRVCLSMSTPSMLLKSDRPLILRGLYPATITPFDESLQIDWETMESHLNDVLAAHGVKGVAVNGGLGELLQLTIKEQADIVRLAKRLARPGQLVIAGVNGNSASAIGRAGLAAKQAGADALLVFPPFDVRAYRRLATDPGSVIALFEELDARVDLPLVVFQYPPNSGCAYPTSVLRALAAIPNVVAVKAATAGDFDAYCALWDALHDVVAVLAGVDSPPLIDMLRYGSDGALIGISAIAPEQWARLLALVDSSDEAEAAELYERVCKPLMASVFENQQPTRLTHEAAATKEALVQMGKIPSSRVRPPAAGVNEEACEAISQALATAGLDNASRENAA